MRPVTLGDQELFGFPPAVEFLHLAGFYTLPIGRTGRQRFTLDDEVAVPINAIEVIVFPSDIFCYAASICARPRFTRCNTDFILYVKAR
jgi:hypothetical protein